MPDREKVIEGIKKILSETDTYDGILFDAISLLKEREAKTVESIQINRNFYAELTGYCPSCKRPLKDRFNKYFCGNCGQAVKWEC